MWPLFFYGCLCLFWAYANARAIQADTWILHGINGLLHLSTCGYFSLKMGPLYGVMCLLEGRLLFDVALNLFRGKSFDYVPLNPKSLVDRAEIAVFGQNGWLPKLVYALCFTVLLFIHN